MKKIIFKFWVINLLISIILFIIYRLIIAGTNYAVDMNLFEKILFIIEAVLDIWFSTVCLIVMLVCSLLFFLNLIEKIRNNYFLSLLTFLGIPTICLIYLIVINIDTGFKFFTTVLVLTIIYVFLTTIEFIKFRKKIKIHELINENIPSS
nr:hypothetical protein [Flavobacterium sp. Fl-33]